MTAALATYDTLQPFARQIIAAGYAVMTLQDGTLSVTLPVRGLAPVAEGDDPAVKYVEIKSPADARAFIVQNPKPLTAYAARVSQFGGVMADSNALEEKILNWLNGAASREIMCIGGETRYYRATSDATIRSEICMGMLAVRINDRRYLENQIRFIGE
ncbi:hypothetical protein [Paraburkholderia sp. GAS32]|uniref:hypothetical protein n=1 Tax=Paraburkholderia sp. GAS32 TaxID=3035129 RepID=UPI003D24464D